MTRIQPSPLRHGFSLMEMILATAILASSGAALFALIGNGSVMGRRAEHRAEALRLAENLLAETLAGITSPDNIAESRWVTRVQRLENPSLESLSLVCVAVEVAAKNKPNDPICRLVRWMRVADVSDGDSP
jgi:prepilin-type N-terminal cleavage/methylation domain-containing protein